MGFSQQLTQRVDVLENVRCRFEDFLASHNPAGESEQQVQEISSELPSKHPLTMAAIPSSREPLRDRSMRASSTSSTSPARSRPVRTASPERLHTNSDQFEQAAASAARRIKQQR